MRNLTSGTLATQFLGRTVVLGAGGFLGSSLLQGLGSQEDVVTGIVRQPQAAAKSNTARKISVGDFHQTDWRGLFSELHPGLLIIASGTSSVGASVADPLFDYRNNFLVLKKILSAAVRLTEPPRIIFLSSAAVYGEGGPKPISEDTIPSAISPYGENRILCEKVLREYAETAGNVDIVRLFSVYGSGLRSRVFWDVGRQLVKNGYATAQGSGEEERDFLHIEDFVRAIRCIVQRRFVVESYQVWNCASGTSHTMREALGTLASNLGFADTPVEFDGFQQDWSPKIWRADISRLSSIGFNPSVTLESGLKDYARFLVSQS